VLESEDDAEVAVDALHRAGLLYKTGDGFVFASRAGSACGADGRLRDLSRWGATPA
jgi:hypothetical protein